MQDRGMRLRALLVLVLLCVPMTAGSGPVRAEEASAAAQAAGPWPAPVLVNPVTIRLRVGDNHLSLDNERDYVLRMPGRRKKTGILYISGGRNIRLIGGYMSVKASDVNIVIRDSGGTKAGRIVHIEGLLIDSSSGRKADGIRIAAPRTIVQLKNVRIVNLRGTAKTVHADLIQPFGGMKELRIDGFTGATHYNDLYFRRENHPLGPAIGTVRIRNANVFGYVNKGRVPRTTLRGISIGTQALDPKDGDAPIVCRLTNPVYLEQFYVKPPKGVSLGQFVFPNVSSRSGCAAKVSKDGKSLDWPALRASAGGKVSGVVKLGPPPNGAFVPPGSAGLGYGG
jgi:hypothetical protein